MRIFKNEPVSPWSWVLAALCGVAFVGYRFSLSETPQTPEQLVRQAEDDLKAQRFDLAEQSVKRLARLHTPTDEDVLLRARIAIAKKQPDEAIEALSHIPDGSPLAGQARLMEGQTELHLQRSDSLGKAGSLLQKVDPA